MLKLDKMRFLSRAAIELGVFSAVINVLLLVMPLYMLQVYDRVIPSHSLDTLLYISLIALIALLVLGVLEAVRALYANRLAARIDVDCGPRLFRATLDDPRAALGQIQPLRDLTTIRGFIGSRAIFSLFDLPFGPFFIALLYLVHPVLFLITLVGGVVMIGLALGNQRATRASARKMAESLSTASGTAQIFARNAETVRTLGMRSGAASHWGTQFGQSIRASDRLVAINALYGSVSRSIRLLLQIAMYGVGAYLALRGEMTAGMIFAASMISARAMQPLDQIVGSWKQISDAAAAWKRITKYLEAADGTSSVKTELPAPQGGVSAEDVVYFLPGTREGAPPLIKRVGFSVEAGETLAIIGPSRAGKSTLARLLVGAIEPHSGIIRFDGADIRTFDREKLGSAIGYLSQEVELFPGTIAQNIARFDPNATSEQVIAAAQKAHVHQMILGQPEGYDTKIGPMGVRLSGGERQRIGLARALYGDPKLIVLDEPNANLDKEGESGLEQAVEYAAAQGSTVITITHRPSIAAKCNRVLILGDGQIEKYGPTSEVLRKLSAVHSQRQQRSEVVQMPAAHRVQVEESRDVG